MSYEANVFIIAIALQINHLTFFELKPYGKLYLIPNFLADDNPQNFLAEMVRQSVNHIRHFIVESEKEGRALIKRLQIITPQSELRLWLLNEHSDEKSVHHLLEALKDGHDAGLMSDAGLPCVADPGYELVSLCHQKNIEIIPLPGTSSIFMALMGSGFSGQNFVFHGYLPIEKAQRIKKLKEIEADAFKKQQTQIFMETPYRNMPLLEDILRNCKSLTKLCIASNISAAEQFIKTKTIREWQQQKPDLHKKPSIFLIAV